MTTTPHGPTRLEQREAELREARLECERLRWENRLALGVIEEHGLRSAFVEEIRRAGERPPSITNEDMEFLVKRKTRRTRRSEVVL